MDQGRPGNPHRRKTPMSNISQRRQSPHMIRSARSQVESLASAEYSRGASARSACLNNEHIDANRCFPNGAGFLRRHASQPAMHAANHQRRLRTASTVRVTKRCDHLWHLLLWRNNTARHRRKDQLVGFSSFARYFSP